MKQTKAILLVMMLAGVSFSDAAETKPAVSLGKDGKLNYRPDARGNQIPDFSRAGYMGGGVKLPEVPVKLTLKPRPGMVKEMQYYSRKAAGAGDDTQRIQEAIKKVSSMPLDKNGFRGAVLLKRGLYRVEGVLRIGATGVVLRGEGQHKNGTILLGTGTKQRGLIAASGPSKMAEIKGSRRKIKDNYVPWGTKTLNLESTRGYSVGDKVIIYRPATQNWLDDIGMSKLSGRGAKPWTVDRYHFRFERVVTAIKGNYIMLDAPTVNAMEDKYGGGFVYRYTDNRNVSQVGIEHLRIVSEYKKEDDEEHLWDGVAFGGVSNSWARNVTAVHTGWGGVRIHGPGRFITVQDCAYLKPISQRKGGRRYPFAVSGQFCLVQRCYSEGGRHCNVAGNAGPNVYLDCLNIDGDAGPHQRWAMGALYDNIQAKSICARNRGSHGGGHGWTGAQMVFWNCETHGLNIQRPPTAELYVIGCKMKKGKPKGAHFESHGKHVTPRSLYLKQLEDRLGKQAVENVTTEQQRKGAIYEVLRKQLAF